MRHKCAEAKGKADRRNPGAGAPEESDGNMVPRKSANKGAQPPAESKEGRKPQEEATRQSQEWDSVSNRDNRGEGKRSWLLDLTTIGVV